MAMLVTLMFMVRVVVTVLGDLCLMGMARVRVFVMRFGVVMHMGVRV